MATATALVPRQTIEEIVRCRDDALRLYDAAFDKIAEAAGAVKAAHEMANRAAPSGLNAYTYDRAPEIRAFFDAVQLPDHASYRRVAQRLTDLQCWAHIITTTDLERLMDSEAKEKLRAQMRYVPDRTNHRGELITEDEAGHGMPPITVENIVATLERFRDDMGLIFRRGLANAFSKLDRRFRSHDGFKIGGRIIVTRMFDDNGRLSYGLTRDRLIDVERVFAILDGKPESSFQSTLWMLESERGRSWEKRQSYHENAYFRVRCFMNGNAHLWFTRDDLVRQVNKLLAEHYGEALGDGQTAEPDPLEERKLTPAKRFGFYPTPPGAVSELFDGDSGWRTRKVAIFQSKDKPRLRVLEPSAGTGNLARRCFSSLDGITGRSRDEWKRLYRFDNMVDCVEIQPDLAAGLQREGIYNRVICADFLTLRPEDFEAYDLVVMNPPFDRERDIDHVTHALKFLKPGGSLHAIMSAGTEFRETRKATAFRDHLKACGGVMWDLPAGSFAESGTWCNTVAVAMTAPKK